MNNKAIINSAFVGYEEFCRSRRVLSTEADNTFSICRSLHILLSLIQQLLIIPCSVTPLLKIKNELKIGCFYK